VEGLRKDVISSGFKDFHPKLVVRFRGVDQNACRNRHLPGKSDDVSPIASGKFPVANYNRNRVAL